MKYTAAILTLAGVIAVGFVIGTAITNASREAREARAFCRLSQMAWALQMYEETNGQFPRLWQQDGRGSLLHSWRVMLLPHLEAVGDFERLDLTKPWDSEPNRTVLRNSQAWVYFAGDDLYFGLHDSENSRHTICVLALVGPDSLWIAETGLPKSHTSANRDAIMLIHVPSSDIEPWEPRDITEEEVRARVEQGEEVFFIDVDRKYGKVLIKNSKLVFIRGY